MVFQDRLGNQLSIGDTITYPVRLGSDMWMEDGMIVRFTEDYGNGQPAIVITKPNTDRVVYITNFSNVTKLFNHGPYTYEVDWVAPNRELVSILIHNVEEISFDDYGMVHFSDPYGQTMMVLNKACFVSAIERP